MQLDLASLLTKHPLLSPLFFVLVRALAIIIPPIPGIAIDAVGMTIFPWPLNFLLAETGVLLGSVTAFWIARIWREPFLKRFTTLQKIHAWQNRLSSTRKFWGWVTLRLFFNPLFDYISYIAGLTTLSTTTFLLTTCIGTAPQLFIMYYLGTTAFTQKPWYGLLFIGSVMLALYIGKKIKNSIKQ